MDTLETLLNYHRQNQDIEGTVVGKYLKDKINAFNWNNGQKINALVVTLNALQKEYFVHDNKDQLVFEGEGKERRPKLQLAMTEEGYTSRRKEILSVPCEIKFKKK